MMEHGLEYIVAELKDSKSSELIELRLEECLAVEGIKTWQLFDANVLEKYLPEKEIKERNIRLIKLPLEWFDDSDYDLMTPDEWLKFKESDGGEEVLLAKAFLAVVSHRNVKTLLFSNFVEWTDVIVEDYDSNDMIWRIRDLTNRTIHQVARIYLKFHKENTQNFVNRISNALWRRENAEKWIKFELLADCLNVDDFEDVKMELLDRIKGLARPKKLNDRDWFISIKEEIKLNFKRTLGMIDLRNAIQSNPSKFPNISLPSDIDQLFLKQKVEYLSNMYNFNQRRNILKFKNLYCITHVLTAMSYVINECHNVERMSLFTKISHKTASLINFKAIEEAAATKTIDFLQAVWPMQLAHLITMALRRAGKGWYDIEIFSWEIYNLAKIKRFLLLVQFHMESSLRRMVENSIKLYSDMLYKPCISFFDLHDDFVWDDNDLITSPFDPNSSHVFYLNLQMNEHGAYYSIDPIEFKPVIMALYETYLTQTHFVPPIDPKIMKELIFDPDLYLSSVGLLESVVVETRENLDRSYDQCVIPLKAYAKKYDIHISLFVMNVSSYLDEYESLNKSAAEIRDEIIFHRAMKKNLERTLPLSIQIGTFLINVSPIKINLVTKRQELADLMMDYLVRKLNNETNVILGEYNAILKTLCEKPPTIERLYETTKWMKSIPENVTRLENSMKVKLFDFAILDDFFFPLPNANFNAKVQALYSPVKISIQIKLTNEMFEEEIERFRKQQIEDLATFSERLEELTVGVVFYNTQFDVGKLTENSIEIKKLWKGIKEFGELGRVLNKRQSLFELPPIDLRPIDSLVISSDAFKDLWVTAADFFKFKDILLENTLTNVGVTNVYEEMKFFKETLAKAVRSFREQEKIQEVAQYFFDNVYNFDTTVECLVLVKNPNWSIHHWQELATRTGMEFKLPLTRNFSYFLNKGILDFIDEVQKLSDEANVVEEPTEE